MTSYWKRLRRSAGAGQKEKPCGRVILARGQKAS
jgi:hypothetical protein